VFRNVDPYQILSYGVIGLGFLLALLAFWLLKNEQQKRHPSTDMLTAVKGFMIFAILLCVIGIVGDGARGYFAAQQAPTGPDTLTVAVLASPSNANKVTVTFVNRTPGEVKLYWINESGTLKHYKDIETDNYFTQDTYLNDRWVVADAENRPIAIYTIRPSTTRVEIK
jgi:hypothetical protein